MRTCARCGHLNPASASTCESCHGLLTLQLHSGAAVQEAPEASPEPKRAPPANDDQQVGPAKGAGGGMLSRPLGSISLKTAEYSPEELSFAESLSARDLFAEDEESISTIDVKPNEAEGLVLDEDDEEESEEASEGDDAPAEPLGPAASDASGLGFSLAGKSIRDDQAIDLAAQIKAHSIADPLLGQQVGNFRFIEKIGRGGFGAVYRAEQVYLGEPAAIKVLHLHQVDNPETVRRFQREARALAQLKHDNIVKMIDFGMLPQYGFYLVMELLSGDNVYNRLRAREPFSLRRLKNVFRQLCDVLDFVDFGIAAISDDIDPITKTGAYIGTATYASPEQIQGTKELDGRSDLYSLGVLLFRMLVGKPPFEGRNAMDITHKKLAVSAPSLAERAPERTWAPALEALMHSVLSREPAFRPPHARAFWDECGPALDAQASLWRQHTQIDEVAIGHDFPGPEQAGAEDASGSIALLTELGILALTLNDSELAESAFRDAVSIAPDRAQLWVNLGNAFRDEHNFEAAANAFRKAEAIHPRNGLAAANRARLARPRSDAGGAA